MINKNSLKKKTKKEQEAIKKLEHLEKVQKQQEQWKRQNEMKQDSSMTKDMEHTEQSKPETEGKIKINERSVPYTIRLDDNSTYSFGSDHTEVTVETKGSQGDKQTHRNITAEEYKEMRDSLNHIQQPRPYANAGNPFEKEMNTKVNPLEKKSQPKRRPRGNKKKKSYRPYPNRVAVLHHYWNRIKSEEDLKKFLMAVRRNIHLDSLPYAEMHKGFEAYKFIMTHKKELEGNVYNIMLFVICLRGSLVLNRLPIITPKNFAKEIIREIRNNSSQWFMKGHPADDGTHKEISKLCDTILDHKKMTATLVKSANELLIFKLPIGRTIITFATREAILLAKIYMESAGIKVVTDKETKKILADHPVNYIDRKMTCFAEIDYLKKIAKISYSNLYSDRSRDSFKEHFEILKSISSKVSHPSKALKNKGQSKGKVTINGEDFDLSVFEEIIEDNIHDFLANIRFEEENYDSKLLSETI